MVLLLHDLTELWGEPHPLGCRILEQPLGKVSTDTRELLKGDFFIPLKGERFDGHEFLAEAFARGAQAALVSADCKVPIPDGFIHWVVEETLIAFQELALLHRTRLTMPFVAITGSVGKTTTREMIRAVFETSGPVLSSEGNYNNDIGVPLTLLKGHSQHKAAVIEMGMRGLGEIERLSKCTQPDIAVITNVGNAHIGLLGTKENIATAKCEITASLNPEGIVVIPWGDPLLESTLSKAWKGKIVRVALESKTGDTTVNDNSDLFLSAFPEPDFIGRVDLSKNLLELRGDIFELPLRGKHNALNFLMALAVASECDISWSLLKMLNVRLPTGRSRELHIGGMTVLDETYNASPEAVLAALDLLMEYSGRHFFVLGSMLELGDQSLSLHRRIAHKIGEISLNGLVVVATGDEAAVMREVDSSIEYFALVNDISQAYENLVAWLRPGDNLLLKGSRKVGLESLLARLQKRYG